MNKQTPLNEIKSQLHGETAKIAWKELLKFFAGGYTIEVQRPNDLVGVAELFVQDQADKIKTLMDQGHVRPVPDDSAKKWLEQDATVWAVVLAPWVLVQEIQE